MGGGLVSAAECGATPSFPQAAASFDVVRRTDARIRMSSVRMLRRVTLWLWLLFALLSYVFGETSGLAYLEARNLCHGLECREVDLLFHARDLESSGGDDDLMISMGVVLALVAVLLGLPRRWSRLAGWELGVHGLMLSLQGLCLALIDQGSLFTTLVEDGNKVLALWLIAYAGLWICWFAGWRLHLGERRSARPLGAYPPGSQT